MRAALLLAGLLGTTVVVGARQSAPTASPAPAPVTAHDSARANTPRGYVEAHCLTCHNDRAKAAGLSLTSAPADVTQDPELWEKVRH